MKKYIRIALTALIALVLFSCKKDADVAASESKLPLIQLSSLGTLQNGPFLLSNANNVLQLLFGATTTNTATGRFTVEILDGTTVVKTVTFAKWTGYDDTSEPDKKPTAILNHSISYTLQPTTYEKTQVYGGSINLKLSLLGLTSGKTYAVRATAYPADAAIKPSVITQAAFFKVQ